MTDNRADCQYCFMLYCVPQLCTFSCTHLCEQLLQVNEV